MIRTFDLRDLAARDRGRPPGIVQEDLIAAVPLVKPWLTPEMTAGYERIFTADCPHHYNF